MVAMPRAEQLLTADEFMRLPERYIELIEGRVVETMPPFLNHGFIVRNVLFALHSFALSSNLGQASGEGSFRLKRFPDTVRAPDVCFLDNASFEKYDPDAYYDGSPTLAVEIVSKNDTLSQTRQKADEFIEAGSKAVWIVHPRQKCVFVRRPDEPEATYVLGQSVPGDEFLPGFELPVANFFKV